MAESRPVAIVKKDHSRQSNIAAKRNGYTPMAGDCSGEKNKERWPYFTVELTLQEDFDSPIWDNIFRERRTTRLKARLISLPFRGFMKHIYPHSWPVFFLFAKCRMLKCSARAG